MKLRFATYHRTFRHGLFLYIISLLSACTGYTENPALVHIDSLLERKEVEKAYAQLLKCKSSIDTLKEADAAYYYLLRTKCQDKLQTDYDTQQGILRSIAFYKEVNDKDKLLQAYYYAGIVQYDDNNKQEAVKNIKKAETLAIENRNARMQIETDLYLSYINVMEGNLQESLAYARKALQQAERTDNKRRMGFCYNQMAVIYNDMQMKDSSHYYSELADKYISYQEPSVQARTYNNKAVDEIDQNNLHKAKALLHKSLAIEDIPHTHYLMARIHHMQGDEENAEKEWQKAIKVKDLRVTIPILQHYANWLLETNRKEEAAEVYKNIKLLEDSVKRVKQGENVLATLHHHEQSIIKHNMNIRTYALISVVILLLALFPLFYKYMDRRRKRQQKRLFDLENKLLIFQQQEKLWKHSQLKSSQKMEKLQEKITLLQEQKEREWKQLNTTHSKTIRDIKLKMEKLKTELPHKLAKGKDIYERVMQNHNISQYKTEDNECFFLYCTLIHPEVIESMPANIKGNIKVYHILLGLNKNEDEIRQIMQLSPSAFRMMKSRYNKVANTQ